MSKNIKQLSVFLENKEGRLNEALNILAAADVNIVALSLADTKDFGMLRMIVSDPEKGQQALKAEGITASLTEVIAVQVSHATGSLAKAMEKIADAGVNVEYMYAFANGAKASAILKISAPETVVDILLGSGFEVWDADEAYRANQ
ncbi:MAG: amino acid-binding protein [Lachnospiraceae bacterium]|jgi:hypothetical protein|nr:amino acid-binding protein [Lachnospiraceae bacterium]